MQDLDDLASQYPQYKNLIQDTRKKLHDIDKEIDKDWPKPKLELKPPGRGTWLSANSQDKRRIVLEEQKSAIGNEFDQKIDKDFEGKDTAVKTRTKEDLSKIINSKEPLRIDIKDVDASQKYANKILQEEKQDKSEFPIADQLMNKLNASRDARIEKFKSNDPTKNIRGRDRDD
jgi:hypothetical protein